MKFNSIDNFEVTINNEDCIKIAKKDASSVMSPANKSDSNRVGVNTVPIINAIDEQPATTIWNGINSFMWVGTILISFVIWITCIVSLVLNCTRKNVGKAVFSGIGLIVPFITITISSIGRSIFEMEESGIGIVLVILALIVQLVVGIMAFIFCFSKSHKN